MSNILNMSIEEMHASLKEKKIKPSDLVKASIEKAKENIVCSDRLDNNCAKDPIREEYNYNNIKEEIIKKQNERDMIQ